MKTMNTQKFIVSVAAGVTEHELREALYHGLPDTYEIVPAPENDERRMTLAQRDKLWDMCARYGVPFREDDYRPTQFSSGAPIMYEGWIGGREMTGDAGRDRRTIYVAVEPNGDSHT